MTVVSIEEYGTRNHYRKAIKVTIGEIQLFFSYNTLVAIYTPKEGIICTENV